MKASAHLYIFNASGMSLLLKGLFTFTEKQFIYLDMSIVMIACYAFAPLSSFVVVFA